MLKGGSIMLSNEVTKLEQENRALKKALRELKEKMEKGNILKPKSCQYCAHYMQHYIKTSGIPFGEGYSPIYAGHCIKGVPVKLGGKRNPKPDDTCPYFEFGTHDTRDI